MHNVLLVIHIILAIGLVGIILMQRSDGDGLSGMGGGGGANAMFTTRGKSNLLTRTTAILATCFMLTSLGLAYLSSRGTTGSIADQVPATAAPAQAETPAVPAAPAVPTGE